MQLQMTYKMTHVIIGFNKQNTEGGNDNTCIQIMLFNRGTLKNFDALSGFSFLISPKSFLIFLTSCFSYPLSKRKSGEISKHTHQFCYLLNSAGSFTIPSSFPAHLSRLSCPIDSTYLILIRCYYSVHGRVGEAASLNSWRNKIDLLFNAPCHFRHQAGNIDTGKHGKIKKIRTDIQDSHFSPANQNPSCHIW